MKKLLVLFIYLAPFLLNAQSLYFPPASGQWDTLQSSSLGWCEDSLNSLQNYLDQHNTKAFILLKDGKIVIEWYFDQFSQDSIWYWASAAKTLTAILVGIAQEKGHLSIHDSTAAYLGPGWTNCPPNEEQKITLWHQLTMTSGLDDGVPDNFCTTDTCLQCIAVAGTRWSYHNAPYTLLKDVVEQATGETYNVWYYQNIANITGMKGLWATVGYNNLFFSTARDMARYGLLNLAGGHWNGTPVLKDTAYFKAMTSTSQSMNKSYGYLWWLNGKGEYMLPQSQVQFSKNLIPSAPEDLYAGLGANDQKLYIVPSQNIVVVRLGNAAGEGAPSLSEFDNTLWKMIGNLSCQVTGSVTALLTSGIKIFPNPSKNKIYIQAENAPDHKIQLVDLSGNIVGTVKLNDGSGELDTHSLPNGLYLLKAGSFYRKVLIAR